MQGRRHQTVAGVEVGLPARSVVLVAPGQVPHRNTRQGHGREPVLRRPEAVLGVVPFDEQRKGEPLSLDGGPGDQAHPPAGVVDVHSPVQVGGLPQALPCEVVPVVGIGCRPPEEPVLGDHLAHRVEDGAVLQGQHLAAHEHRALGEAGEGEGTRDAVGLEEYVVVQQDVMRRVGLGEHLVHRPGETTAPAEVGLLDQVQLLSEKSSHRREAGGVAHLLVTLVGDDHLGDQVADDGIVRECGKRGDAVVGTVEGADADRQAGGLGGSLRSRPGRLVDREGLIVSGEVEPVPATVLERSQVEFELEVAVRPGGGRPGHMDDAAVSLGAVDVHPSPAGHTQAQHHRVEHGPPTPVAGREGVEVGGERHLVAVRDHGFESATRLRLTERRLVDVEGSDLPRVTRTWQEDPLQQRHCLAGGQVVG